MQKAGRTPREVDARYVVAEPEATTMAKRADEHTLRNQYDVLFAMIRSGLNANSGYCDLSTSCLYAKFVPFTP